MDADQLYSQLDFNTGEFPKNILRAAVEQRASLVPLLLAELKSAAADPQTLLDKGDGYMRHIYAMYLLGQFREAAAFPLIVEFVRAPDEVVTDLMGDVVTEDLGRILASVCHGNIAPIKRIIEDPEVNEWVRSAGIDALLVLYREGQLSRDSIMDYLRELFSLKVERKPSFVWSAMVHSVCDLYPKELLKEIERAYADGLVDPGHVSIADVERTLREGKEERLEKTQRYQRGLIGDVVDEIGWWACFGKRADDDNPDRVLSQRESEYWSPAVNTVVRSESKIGRNSPCPCGSGKKYKKCCLRTEKRLH